MSIWDFDHLPSSQSSLSRFQTTQDSSPVIDLSGGFSAYSDQVDVIRAERRKFLKAARDLGELRLEFNSKEDTAFQTILRWKSLQYNQSGNDDLFQVPWIHQVCRAVHQAQTPWFSGALALLYAGDQLIAGHFGMLGGSTLHWWFPSYDPQFAKYSPGTILLAMLAESSAERGIKIIDLGKGTSLYKKRFMNGAIPLSSGSLTRPSWPALQRRISRTMRSIAKAVPGAMVLRDLLKRKR